MGNVEFRLLVHRLANVSLSQVVLGAVSVFLVVANLARFGHPFITGGIPVLELALYAVVGVVVAARRVFYPRAFLIPLAVLWIAVVLGILRYDALLTLSQIAVALLYTLRISMALLAVNVVGWALAQRWSDPRIVRRWVVGIGILDSLIGFLLLAVFPHMIALQRALARVGVVVVVDPHIWRLVGPFLDPNYFGNLVLFPFMISLVSGLTAKEGRERLGWTAAAILMTIALALTVSRSTMIGAVVALTTLGALLSRRDPRMFRRFGLVVLVLILTLAAFAAFSGGGPIDRLVARFATLGSDPSAQERLHKLLVGLNALQDPQVFLFGVGYNLVPYLFGGKYVVINFDASLLVLVVCLGVPGTVIAALPFLSWVRTSLRAAYDVDPSLHDACLSYMVAALVMSLFNNLLLNAYFILLTLSPIAFATWSVGRDQADAGGTKNASRGLRLDSGSQGPVDGRLTRSEVESS